MIERDKKKNDVRCGENIAGKICIFPALRDRLIGFMLNTETVGLLLKKKM